MISTAQDSAAAVPLAVIIAIIIVVMILLVILGAVLAIIITGVPDCIKSPNGKLTTNHK